MTQETEEQGVVTLIPFGNIANRLLAVSSAISYFSSIEKPVEIVWFKTPELCSEFERLFHPDISLDEKYVSVRNATIKDHIFRDIPNGRNFFLSKLHALWAYDHCINSDHYVSNEELRKEIVTTLSSGKNIDIWLALNRAFYITPRMFDNLMPSVEVVSAVRSICSGWTENVIGVHILRGDEQYSWRQDPIDLYIRRMQKLIETDPSVKFFLSADNYEDRDRIATIFGSRVFTPKLQKDPDTVEGVIQAMAEILALSKTKYILGGKDNPYCTAATLIGEKPLEQISIYL